MRRTKHLLPLLALIGILSGPVGALAQDTPQQTRLPEDGEEIVLLKTNYGVMKARLFGEETPITVENFRKLANERFYDGVLFHRVIPNFMIQTGDPLSRDDKDPSNDGTGGPGYMFEDEFSPFLRNIRGALSMANSGPGTNGSQFFINQVDNTHLDNKHTVFGQVYDGLEVLESIAKLPTDETDHPLEEAVLEAVLITTAGSDADLSSGLNDTTVDTEHSYKRPLIKTILYVLLILIGIGALLLIGLLIYFKRSMPTPRPYAGGKSERKKRHKTYGISKR